MEGNRDKEAKAEAEASLERAKATLKDELDEIATTHAGQPQPTVLAALERAVSQSGVTPEPADLSALARRISDDSPPEEEGSRPTGR